MTGSTASRDDDLLVLTPDAFARAKAIAESKAGLAIPETKAGLVQSRINRRLRATGIARFEDYLDFVESEAGREECAQMINALTTNVSSFFREEHHFATLRNEVLADLLKGNANGRRLRIWSAGCSTGQEPYSIAMTLLDVFPDIGSIDAKILATDIDREVLARAMAGTYASRELSGIPEDYRKRFLTTSGDSSSITPSVRDLITFRHLNLMDPWPMTGQFDAVFCRNVVIYFADNTQRELWPRFARAVAPGGMFFLGHSERMHDPAQMGFVPAGVTTYRKTRPAGTAGLSGKD